MLSFICSCASLPWGDKSVSQPPTRSPALAGGFHRFVKWSGTEHLLMLPLSADTEWHTGYAWVHLRKAWTLWNVSGNNSPFPSKNIYSTQLHRIHSGRNYPCSWRHRRHYASSRWQRVCVPSKAKKENTQRYFCLLFWQRLVDRRACSLHWTGQLVGVCLWCWFVSSFCCPCSWFPHYVINHSISAGMVSWHHLRYISNHEPVFDWGCKSLSASSTPLNTNKNAQKNVLIHTFFHKLLNVRFLWISHALRTLLQ